MTTTQNQIITVKELQDKFFGDIDKAINHALSLYGHRPSKLEMLTKKPFLANLHTSEDAKKYATALADYEKINTQELEKYEAEKSAYDNRVSEINSVIQCYIMEEAGINSVPDKYRDKLWSKAYSDGHSDGYYSVYQQLCSLVEIFA